MARVRLLIGAAVIAALLASCGSRSGLLAGSSSSGAGGTAAGTSGLGGGGAPGGTGGGGTGGGPFDAGPDAPPPKPCKLAAAGSVLDVVSLPDRHATAPSAVTVEPGAPGSPARIAVQVFASGGSSTAHDDIQLVRFAMAPPWPAGWAQDSPAQQFGIESHGWGNLVNAPPDRNELALAWHGDPGGKGRPMFRLWDVGNWTPGPPVDIAPEGEAVLDLAAGASVGPMGVGYSGQGYAVIWREVQTTGEALTHPVVAVLDAEGQLQLGPHSVAGYADYPGRAPMVVWTGQTYLMATSYLTCPPVDPFCQPMSVVLTRLRPASGDLYDDSGVELASVVPMPSGTVVVGRADVAHHAGRTYLAWSEAESSEEGAPRRIRAAELSPDGGLLAGPVVVDEAAPMVSRITLLASDLGVSLSWAEHTDLTVPDNVIGRSQIVTTHLGPDLEMLSYRVTVPATLWHSYGAPLATPLAEPKSLLIFWAGRRVTQPSYDDTWAVRLDCVP